MNYIEKLIKLRGYTRAPGAATNIFLNSAGETVQITAIEDAKNMVIEDIFNDKTKHYVLFFKTLRNPQRKKLENYSKYISFEILVLEEVIHVLRGYCLLPQKVERAPECTYPRDKLPRMLTADPLTKAYGFLPGEVIRIYRQDGTIYYRTIVAE